jgi:hypothetical protein
MATRALDRSKRRMPCRVHAEGRQHNGIVLDLSGSGLFIQTSAKLPPGAHVQIDLSLPEGEATMTVEVVRRKQVPAQLLTVAHGGIGVRILSAPEAYYRFLQDVQERERQQAAREEAVGAKSAPAAGARSAAPKSSPVPSAQAPAAPTGPRFRVRVSQTSGIRSRTVIVAAASADEASRSTQAELGDDWKVIAVEPL